MTYVMPQLEQTMGFQTNRMYALLAVVVKIFCMCRSCDILFQQRIGMIVIGFITENNQNYKYGAKPSLEKSAQEMQVFCQDPNTCK